MICCDLSSKKRVNYLSCIEGKGVVKTFTEMHKMPRYLWIFNRISVGFDGIGQVFGPIKGDFMIMLEGWFVYQIIGFHLL